MQIIINEYKNTVPVAHKTIAYKGEQQQDDSKVELKLLIFIFVGKPDKEILFVKM